MLRRLVVVGSALVRFAREDVKNYLVMTDKKPLSRQVREFSDLWRRYRYFPYHYLKNDLYLNPVGDSYRDYFPSVLADHYVREVNPPECEGWLEDKLTFDQRMRAAGLPVVPILARVNVNDGAVAVLDRADRDIGVDGLADKARALGLASVFVKPRFGLQGLGAFRLDVSEAGLSRKGAGVDRDALRRLLNTDEGFQDFLVQPYFQQHAEISRLNPKSVNTLRVITLRTDSKVDVICVIFRVGGAGSETDNGSHGGYYMRVDLDTGAVNPVAHIQLTFGKQRRHERHGETKVAFGSVTLPYAREVRDLVAKAALAFAPVRIIGWDVAIGADGPVFIEGNFYPGFRPVQDVCGGLGPTAIGREIAAKHGWREAGPGPAAAALA